MEIRPPKAAFLYSDRQTDKTMLTGNFRNYVNAEKYRNIVMTLMFAKTMRTEH